MHASRASQEAAAILTMQCLWRVAIARRKSRHLRAYAAATVVQSVARGYVCRRRVGRYAEEKRRADADLARRQVRVLLSM
jgi:hypothetical protein